MIESVKLVNSNNTKIFDFKNQFVGCIILTNENQILLQQRDHDFKLYPDFLCEFGGHLEPDEQPSQAMIRELNEELGAIANENELISLGAITENSSNHSELIYTYFWHDVNTTITGCYEGTAKYFLDIPSILKYPKITDGLRWMLWQCQIKNLLNK